MKPTKTLIEALYSAADRIEFGAEYLWLHFDRCNCGILAQELLGLSADDLKIHARPHISLGFSWQDSARDPKNFCQITGLPLSAIAQDLYKHGLEKDDFSLIENAGSTCRSISMLLERQDPKFVANYFRELAAKLQIERKGKV